MVMFLSTLQLWLIIGISSIILLLFLIIVFLCVWGFNAKKKCAQLYTIEDLPSTRKNSFFEIINIYRHFNSFENVHDKLLKDDQSDTDQNLVDSTDLSNKFTNSLLRINSDTDDMCSHTSTGSLGTYYSTNYSRSNSKCTFVSCSEGSDPGGIVV